jgi:hypothetical protein
LCLLGLPDLTVWANLWRAYGTGADWNRFSSNCE